MEQIPIEKIYRSENYVFDEEKVWTKLSWFNDVLEIDRYSGNARMISLPKNYINKTFSYRSINKYENRLVIIPFREKKLLVLNLDREEYEEISLPETALQNGETAGFIQSVIVGEELIMFGYYPRFVIYNFKSGAFRVIEGIRNFYSPDFELASWTAGWAVVKNKLFVHILKTNSLIVLDLVSNTLSIRYIGEYDHISGFCGFYENRFWFDIADENEAYKLISADEQFCDIKEYTLHQITNIGIRPVSWFAVSQGKSWLFPGKLDKPYIYDIDRNELSESKTLPSISVDEMERRAREIPMNYMGLTQMGDSNVVAKNGIVIAIHVWSGKLIEFNVVSNNLKVTNINLLNESYSQIRYETIKGKGLKLQEGSIVDESLNCKLTDYVSLLSFE